MFVSKRTMRLDEEILSVEERNGQENTPNPLLNDSETFVLIHNTIFFLLCSLLYCRFFFTLMMAFALRKPSTESNHIVTMTID